MWTPEHEIPMHPVGQDFNLGREHQLPPVNQLVGVNIEAVESRPHIQIIDCFRMLWTDEVAANCLTDMNSYASKHLGWVGADLCSLNEFNAFLSISCFVRGIIRVNNRCTTWKSSIFGNVVRSLMSEQRFTVVKLTRSVTDQIKDKCYVCLVGNWYKHMKVVEYL